MYQSAQTVVVLAQANVTVVVVVPTIMINAVLTQVETELAVIVLQKILAVNTHKVVVLVLTASNVVRGRLVDVVKKDMIVVMEVANN